MLKKRILLPVIIVLVILLVMGGISYYRYIKNGASLVSGFLTEGIDLRQKNASINVLILGIGGGNHEGPDLSDTIIFANIKPSKNEVNLVSIPRDLWVTNLQLKINAIYPMGKTKSKGIYYSKEIMGSVLEEPIDYVLVVNFSAFEQFIDLLGGVDIDVRRSFDDYFYPIAGKEDDLCGYREEEKEFAEEEAKQLNIKPGKIKVLLDKENKIATAAAESGKNIVFTPEQINIFFACRFEHLRFEKVLTHMDGATALKFVRSRHALGEEGTDFARSQRQQQVISAVKDKLFSLGTILNPVKIVGIYNLVRDNIDTDIPIDKADDFVELAKKMQGAKISTVVIDAGDIGKKRPGLLTSQMDYANYGGQWVLVPRLGGGNFSEIHTYVDCIIQGKICEIAEKGINIYEKAEKNP